MSDPSGASAWVGERRIATSDDVVNVEGNAYFPLSDVDPAVLTPSRTRTLCLWKGIAGYYTLDVDGAVLRNAAWTYRKPSPLARRIKDRVAFTGVVDVRRGVDS